jgi:hypothetical protein
MVHPRGKRGAAKRRGKAVRVLTPSTGQLAGNDGADPAVLERGAVGPGGTRTAVKGEVSPRLPHERDESSDSGTREPSEVMHKAAGDMQDGRTDAPRGPETQKRYSELTQKTIKQVKP